MHENTVGTVMITQEEILEKAREIGSDYIVVGRSITKAVDPVAAYERAMQDFVG